MGSDRRAFGRSGKNGLLLPSDRLQSGLISMFVRRVLGGIWKVVTHPAFWMPIILDVTVDVYMDGLRLDVKRIVSDGWGYYLPLPAVFVYGDPHLAFLNRPDLASDFLQFRWPDGTWHGLHVYRAGYLDKYALGP